MAFLALEIRVFIQNYLATDEALKDELASGARERK
jgi:hypothetical protein